MPDNQPPQTSIILYQTEDGQTRIQCQVTRELEHYSLPAILAIGDRVRSPRGTQFRQWATARLSEYLVKGFAMDDERLKNPPGKGHTDCFDELLERAILPDAGKVSREQADAIAEQEYDRFDACRRARLEDEGEADTLKQLENQLKKLTETKRPRRKKP